MENKNWSFNESYVWGNTFPKCKAKNQSPINIDTDRFEKISINAEKIEVNRKYNSVFSKSNIEDQIQKSPINLMVEWNSQNILKLGNENKLVVNILDASITLKPYLFRRKIKGFNK